MSGGGLSALVVAAGVTLFAWDSEASGRARPLVVSGVVNLNDATAAQLDLLPGIGQAAAERIIAYRTKRPFTRPEELVKVKGFGKKRFEGLKPHLTVSGPTTLTVRRQGWSQGRTYVRVH